eukprot:6198549-Pleurochrysis_carterae.AAC.7
MCSWRTTDRLVAYRNVRHRPQRVPPLAVFAHVRQHSMRKRALPLGEQRHVRSGCAAVGTGT